MDSAGEHKLPNFRRKSDETNFGKLTSKFKIGTWGIVHPRFINFPSVDSCFLDYLLTKTGPVTKYYPSKMLMQLASYYLIGP